MSWELVVVMLAGVCAVSGLVWVGFSSGKKDLERAAKAEEQRAKSQEDLDAIVRFNKGERSARDRSRSEQLRRMRERARRKRRDS